MVILSLAVIGLILLSALVKIYKRSQYLKTVTKLREQSNPNAETVKESLKKLGLIKERLNPTFSPVEIIDILYDLLPSGISLVSFDLKENGNISLEGISLVMADVFTFQSRLEKSARFKNVEVKFASKRNSRLGEITDFKITCQVEKKIR